MNQLQFRYKQQKAYDLEANEDVINRTKNRPSTKLFFLNLEKQRGAQNTKEKNYY